MCIFVILSSFEAYCQEVKYTISGTINSSQGEPLVEVTVKVGNGSSGTVTDIDGKYSLKVAKGRHKLTVSCIGYKEKIQILFVESNCTINFSLEEDVVMMNNVVVVGESKNTKVKVEFFLPMLLMYRLNLVPYKLLLMKWKKVLVYVFVVAVV